MDSRDIRVVGGEKLMIGVLRLAGFSLLLLSCSSAVLAQADPAPEQAPAVSTGNHQKPVEQSPTGSITGTVIDGTGAVIVGAQVTLTNGEQSSSPAILSDEDGTFSFTNVVPGEFQIRITAPGFTSQTTGGTLHPGEKYSVPPVVIALASVNTVIQVRVPPVEIAEEQIKAQEKQRVLGVVPNFYVTYAHDAAPLNWKQKFKLAWKSSIDPVTFALTGIVAGADQAQNAFSGYGQGMQGYAKRFGATYADTTTSTFIGSALLPALLRQDPRYFYKGTGSTRSRILYAVANSVICKGDNQRWQPNYSAILGGFASGAISNLYYPPKDRGAALVFENTGIGTGMTAILNLLQEFVVKRVTPHVSQ